MHFHTLIIQSDLKYIGMPLGAAVVGAVVVVRHQMRAAATLDALATAVDSDFPIPHKRQRQADGVLFELKPRRVGLGLPPLFPSPESRSHPLSNQTRRTQPIAPPRFVHLPASQRKHSPLSRYRNVVQRAQN